MWWNWTVHQAASGAQLSAEQRQADDELEVAGLDALCDVVLCQCASAPDHLRRRLVRHNTTHAHPSCVCSPYKSVEKRRIECAELRAGPNPEGADHTYRATG